MAVGVHHLPLGHTIVKDKNQMLVVEGENGIPSGANRNCAPREKRNWRAGQPLADGSHPPLYLCVHILLTRIRPTPFAMPRGCVFSLAFISPIWFDHREIGKRPSEATRFIFFTEEETGVVNKKTRRDDRAGELYSQDQSRLDSERAKDVLTPKPKWSSDYLAIIPFSRTARASKSVGLRCSWADPKQKVGSAATATTYMGRKPWLHYRVSDSIVRREFWFSFSFLLVRPYTAAKRLWDVFTMEISRHKRGGRKQKNFHFSSSSSFFVRCTGSFHSLSLCHYYDSLFSEERRVNW